jgi:hypothetical protein
VAQVEQDVEGVVDRLAEEVVAVVPAPHFRQIDPVQIVGEGAGQFGLGVAAQGGGARVEGEVLQVVQPGEQRDLGELAHPGQQHEFEVRVQALDGRIEIAQALAHGPRPVRGVQVVQDRLVVFVDQHHHRRPGGLGQPQHQFLKAAGDAVPFQNPPPPPGLFGQLHPDPSIQFLPGLEHPRAEIEAQHRVASAPVPVVLQIQPREQLPAAGEGLGQGVDQQALAEAPRPGQEVVFALRGQAGDVGGLVDVDVTLGAHLAQVLQADGQFLFHGGGLRPGAGRAAYHFPATGQSPSIPKLPS